MSFFRHLLRDFALVLLIPAALTLAALLQFFPLAPEQWRTIYISMPVATAAIELVLLAALWRFSAPLRAALAEPRLDPAVVSRGAQAALKLPARAAAFLLVLCAAASAVVVSILVAQGLQRDAAAACCAVAVAASILGAMLAYSVAASVAGRELVRLGPAPEFRPRGTVRGKILAVGFGLLTVALLLFGSLGYMGFREEAERDYLEEVDRAQQGAIAATGSAPGPRPAEFVWLALGVPSAVVDAGGRVTWRFGPGDAPFTDGDPGQTGTERVAGGWLARRALSRQATLVSWLPDAPLEARRGAFWSSALGMGAAVYLAAGILIWLAARAITHPIGALGDTVGRIASGDLTANPPSSTRDELGRLAADLRRMAQGLTALVTAVQEATLGVAQAARELSDIGERVKRGALDQHAGVVSVEGSVEHMQSSIGLVSKGVRGLSEYMAATSTAVGQMATALDEVRRQGSDLEQAMNAAMAEVDGLAEAGRKAQQALGTLDDTAGRTRQALARVDTSVSGLELAAVSSQLNAAQAEELAQLAAGVVEATVRGIESVRSAVDDAQQRVTALGRRAGDIDQIVDFISGVAGRTNLLSLNASIIAAQAGEHGKPFGVVADQIRDLAAQIASSTKSIGDIIGAVRDDVEGTAALISRGDALAAEGVRLAQDSVQALVQIRSSTAQGNENAARIQAAVQTHVASTREVSQLVGSVADGGRAVSEAVQRIGASVAALETVARTVGGMADRVTRALEEQTSLGKKQLQSLERIDVMIEEINRAVGEHGGETQRVQESLRELGEAAAKHEQSVEELAALAVQLQGRARALAERVGRFKTGP